VSPPRKHFVQQGQRFGRGIVIDPEVRVRKGKRTGPGARLRCDCGREYEDTLASLVNGNKKSCGCLTRDRLAELARSPEVRELGRQRALRWNKSPEGREASRRSGRAQASRLLRSPAVLAYRASAANLARLAEYASAYRRSPENLERLRQFWRQYWSVPRVGELHEPLEGPGYVECTYCDPPRHVPEGRWEGHWSRNHEPRLKGA
jgi:hypothetical protein